MKKKLPRDASQRAYAVVEQAVAEPTETPEELYQLFWEETGVVAPTQEIHPPLVDKWGEEERWRVWREWVLRRKMGAGKPHDHAAAGRKGGLKGGKARAAKLSAEERSEIAKKAAAARWKRPS